MNRRDFLSAVGAVAVAGPVLAGNESRPHPESSVLDGWGVGRTVQRTFDADGKATYEVGPPDLRVQFRNETFVYVYNTDRMPCPFKGLYLPCWYPEVNAHRGERPPDVRGWNALPNAFIAAFEWYKEKETIPIESLARVLLRILRSDQLGLSVMSCDRFRDLSLASNDLLSRKVCELMDRKK